MEEPQREIRAVYTTSTVTVYQAYSPEIGLPAVREGRFPTAWKRDWMTWVTKPRSRTLSVADHRACERHAYPCEPARLPFEGT